MSKKPRRDITLNEFSFWLLVAAAFLYVLSLIFNYIEVLKGVVYYLQGVASAAMICVVAILAWRFVAAKKQAVWIVLYILVLLIALVCIVLPLVLK